MNPFVNESLINYAQGIVEGFGFNGIRLDSAAYIPDDFWFPFVDSLGDIFMIADILKTNEQNVTLEDMHSALEFNGGPFPSVMNYPLFQVLQQVFADQGSLILLQNFNSELFNMFSQEEVGVLGNFIENHMFNRFLSLRNNLAAYRNAIAYIMLSRGIPIIYYGTEQGFSTSFRSLWPDFNVNSDLYQVSEKSNHLFFFFVHLNPFKVYQTTE